MGLASGLSNFFSQKKIHIIYRAESLKWINGYEMNNSGVNPVMDRPPIQLPISSLLQEIELKAGTDQHSFGAFLLLTCTWKQLLFFILISTANSRIKKIATYPTTDPSLMILLLCRT